MHTIRLARGGELHRDDLEQLIEEFGGSDVTLGDLYSQLTARRGDLSMSRGAAPSGRRNKTFADLIRLPARTD